MTDRELLELAAKASEIELWHESVFTKGLTQKVSEQGIIRFNPLESDGDALRLAVKLGMDITRFAEHSVEVTGRSPTHGTPGSYVTIRNWLNMDPYAATRRAIVRAAAEIGRTVQ